MTIKFIAEWAWTDERVQQFRDMIAKGMSFGEIADRLGGVTRNACIGKAHRLGLYGKKRAAPKPKQTTPQKPAHVIVQAKTLVAPVLSELPESLVFTAKPVTLLELERHHCRWPVADSLFCGAAKQDGSSYCTEHRRTSKAARHETLVA